MFVEYTVAEIVGDILCFSEDEADALGGLLRHQSEKVQPSMQGVLLLLATMLTDRSQDRFEVHRFSISVEPMRTRQ